MTDPTADGPPASDRPERDCLFCRMVAGEIAVDAVRDRERTLAFRDIDPQAPSHVLVVPRTHAATLAELVERDPGLTAELFAEAAAVAEQEQLGGYRTVVNTGESAGQSVHHVHVHVLGGRPFGWPPG